MKAKLKQWGLPLVLVLILFVPIVKDYMASKKINILEISDLKKTISDTAYGLIYFGESLEDKDLAKSLSSIKKTSEVEVYGIDKTSLTKEELQTLQNLIPSSTNESGYAFIVNNEIRMESSTDITEEKINSLIKDYKENVVGEAYYKTVSTAKEFTKLLESKKLVMHVFGRNSCGWCNRFKPIYNEYAKENNFDVYYYDSDSFNQTEYSKILNSGIMIPASCASKGEAEPLSNGFGTPLTLFTKKGKVVGCISGFVNKTSLASKIDSIAK